MGYNLTTEATYQGVCVSAGCYERTPTHKLYCKDHEPGMIALNEEIEKAERDACENCEKEIYFLYGEWRHSDTNGPFCKIQLRATPKSKEE